MIRYRFISAEQATYPVALLCRVLGAARSGYYAWARRRVSARAHADEALTVRIARVHAESRQTDGAPQVRTALRVDGVRCGSRRVARLMRASGLVGCRGRIGARTTVADPAAAPAPNLVRATSPPRHRIGRGLAIARPCRPGRAGPPSPCSWMAIPAASSAGRWRTARDGVA
jgi:transposase InsO family protein